MRILLVSWEYPPVVVGGLGRHVGHLATGGAAAGPAGGGLSPRPPGTPATTHPTTAHFDEGVLVVAVAEDPPVFEFGSDMVPWTLAMGHAMVRAGIALGKPGLGDGWHPDVVHAHDWLVAHPAIALAEFYDVPLVSTIHATEAGRHSGWVSGRINRQVHSIEWWLANESDALIVCSESMRDEITRLFGPFHVPVTLIHNGIEPDAWPYRERRGHTGPPRLLFVGRLEYEKGIHDAIAALPRIRRAYPGTTLTIVGGGTQETWLREIVRRHRVVRAVEFTGILDRAAILDHLHRADALIVPSRYEPFGLVALEAAAAGTPVIAARTGGLAEAVIDGKTGRTFTPGDAAGLAAAVTATLNDPVTATEMARAARDRLEEDFDWGTVAEATVGVLRGAKRRVRAPLARPTVLERPLPERDTP